MKSIPASLMRPICSITSSRDEEEEASTLLSLMPMAKEGLVSALMRRMICRTISARLAGLPPNSSVLRFVVGDRNWVRR
jgi:hypothetical protein